MTEFPLLFLKIPEISQKNGQPSFNPENKFHIPDFTRQKYRINSMFKDIVDAYTCKAYLQTNPDNIDPEHVIVWEYIGNIEDIANAVKRIPGLEWMGETECRDIASDEDFFNKKNIEEPLVGRLYLTMANKSALQHILSLWQRYQESPKGKIKGGLTKFRDLFEKLKSVRRWDVQDRLMETGLLECWEEDLRDDPERGVFCEIELWYRESEQLRNAKAQHVTSLIHDLGGEILQESIIEAIAYHALLAKLPASAAQKIISDPSVRLVNCNDIMFLRPTGQIITKNSIPDTTMSITLPDAPEPSGTPTVALLDGMPLENHSLLANRLFVDDPDNWQENYPVNARCHGTSMASLIIYGDLNLQEPPISRPLYVRPIMQPRDSLGSCDEVIPPSYLSVDLIHNAVRRIFDGDGELPAVAPDVQIINLSIGDPMRQFTYFMSPLARLLDWLSYKYSVLFIVSAGNHKASISLPLSTQELEKIQPEFLEKVVLQSLIRDRRNRRLLSPAETINGITVGALHHDEAEKRLTGNTIKNPFTHSLPSPISSFGKGYKNSIKPDLVFTGGRQFYRFSPVPSKPVDIHIIPSSTLSGNRSAIPIGNHANNNETSNTCGTSNATALISHYSFFCLENLDKLISEKNLRISRKIKISLLKALLVHGCSWEKNDNDTNYGMCLKKLLKENYDSKLSHHLVRDWMGYGVLFSDRIMPCTQQRATMLGYGELKEGEAHVFRIPIPRSLNSQRILRRLTVTLAWLSPIAAKTQKYRSAKLWFEVEKNKLANDRQGACGGNNGYKIVRNGTVQHETFRNEQAEVFKDELTIQVNCCTDAVKHLHSTIGYGLVVSLEVSPGVELSIYDEIKAHIAQPIAISSSTNLN